MNIGTALAIGFAGFFTYAILNASSNGENSEINNPEMVRIGGGSGINKDFLESIKNFTKPNIYNYEFPKSVDVGYNSDAYPNNPTKKEISRVTDDFLVVKKNSNIIGGYDIRTKQSLTASAAKVRASSNNLFNLINKSSSSGSSSSKKTKKEISIKDNIVKKYEEKNLVTTTKTKKEIEKEEKFKSSAFGKAFGW